MFTINEYLTETEARAEQAYREAYRAEYERVYEGRHAADRTHLVYWSDLAHRVGRAARNGILRTAATTPEAVAPKPQPEQEPA